MRTIHLCSGKFLLLLLLPSLRYHPASSSTLLVIPMNLTLPPHFFLFILFFLIKERKKNPRGPTLDTKSLTYEFYQVLVGDPTMNLHGWKQLALWSMQHSCLDDDQRAQLQSTFEREWAGFCQWVVDTYSQFCQTISDSSS